MDGGHAQSFAWTQSFDHDATCNGVLEPAARRAANCRRAQSIIARGMTFTFRAPYARSKSNMFTAGNQYRESRQTAPKSAGILK
jgi:hypothetical protein